MKRFNKSVTLFVILWLIAIALGYSLSRNPAFAQGGNCGDCAACVTYAGQIAFKPASGSGGFAGWTLVGTNNSWADMSFTGTGSGGESSLYYSTGCNDVGSAGPSNPAVKLTYWEFTSNTASCTLPSDPSVPYMLQASSGVGQEAITGATQQVCNPGGG